MLRSPASFEQGLRPHQQGSLQEAERIYRSILHSKPQHFDALHLLGVICGQTDRLDEALGLLERALRERPHSAPALNNLGNTLGSLERHPEAVETFQRALPLGKDVAQIHFALASLGAEAPPPAAPPLYVEALFDGYAGNFDRHLVENLGYRTPALLAEALRQAGPPTAAAIIDLGCGTGLCGPLLRPWASRLVGVDLSSQMLAKAKLLGIYDDLIHAELGSALLEQAQAFDLAVAADVFVYIGALEAVFAATATALRPGGLFAFSVEACDRPDVDFELGPSRRYRHTLAYLKRLAAGHGFSLVSSQGAVLRQESEQAVEGWLIVMHMAQSPANLGEPA